MRTPKAIVLLSGGLDSATTLAIASAEGFECFALSVVYGQRHSSELEAAKRIAQQWKVVEHKLMRVDLDGLGGSALTDARIAVPEGPTAGIPVTYVPARNTIMLSLALAWAEVIEADAIFIGVNALDYSVAGHTKVWIRSGKQHRLMRIDELCSLPADHYETIAVDRESLELQWKRITGRFRHAVGSRRCFRVRLERGQEIEITEDHSLFTIAEGGCLAPIEGRRVEVGMPLVVPFDLRELASSWSQDLAHLDLRNLGDAYAGRSSVREDGQVLTNRLRRTRIPLDLPVTDDFLRVVGLWLAEGGKDPSSPSDTLSFSIGAIEGAPELLKRYFGQFAVAVGKSPANDFDYRASSSVTREVFYRLDLLATAKSGQKRFPAWFWSLSQRQRRIVVAGLWDGDGCQVWHGEAAFHQKSHLLVRDLYQCLLLDGIFASLKKAPHQQLRLALTRATDMARFASLYPLWHASKLKSLQYAGSKVGREKTTGLWKSESVWEAVASATLPAGRKTQIYNDGGKYDMSVRAQRRAFVDVPALRALVASKLAFLRVTAIEPVEHEFMYDLAVEDAENFLADGFLAHNSGYPDCRPEYIEAFRKLSGLATKAGVAGRRTRIETPLIALSKADIIRRGMRLGVDYASTVSCYQADPDGRACGRCDACRLRRKGFAEAGVTDPTRYQLSAPP